MAKYTEFAQHVEVNGETIMATMNAFPDFMRIVAQEILYRNGICFPEAGKWYSQQAWLNSIKTIEERFGNTLLFEIGKAIVSHAVFPKGMTNIHEAMYSLNNAYHSNHRNGEIGYYRIVFHDKLTKMFKICCKNPYPAELDRGIITALAEKFSNRVEVIIDNTTAAAKNDADEYYYLVFYN